jgi:hypothetical protein
MDTASKIIWCVLTRHVHCAKNFPRKSGVNLPKNCFFSPSENFFKNGGLPKFVRKVLSTFFRPKVRHFGQGTRAALTCRTKCRWRCVVTLWPTQKKQLGGGKCFLKHPLDDGAKSPELAPGRSSRPESAHPYYKYQIDHQSVWPDAFAKKCPECSPIHM